MADQKKLLGAVRPPSQAAPKKMIDDQIGEDRKHRKEVRVSFDLPDELHINLKYYAMMERKTIAAVMKELAATLPKAPQQNN